MNDVELVVNSSDNMDLVASSSDDESTLRAVLAFVEGSDCSGSSMDASPSESPSNESHQAPRARTAKYTTQLQRRKRAEVAALRDEAASLEALLAQIQRVHASETGAAVRSSQGGGGKPASRWRQAALTEHQKRRRAEMVNGRLRASLQRHRALGDAVLHVLRKRSGAEASDMAAVEASVSTHAGSLRAGLGFSFEAELQRSMTQLRAETHFVFQPELFSTSGVTRVSSSFELVRDASGAVAYIEVRTSTPVEYSQREAAQTLWWDRLLSGQRMCPNKRHVMVPGRDGLTLEKRFVMALAPEQSSRASSVPPVQLTGMHLVQRFDSRSDSEIVTSAVVLAPSSGLQFREHSWIKISAAPSPLSGAVVETCYRVYPGKRRGSISGEPPDTKEGEAAFVFQTLAGNTRLGMQAAQNELLSGELFRQVAAFYRGDL